MEIFDAIKERMSKIKSQPGEFMIAQPEELNKKLMALGSNTWRGSLTTGQKSRLTKYENTWASKFHRSAVNDERAFFHVNDNPDCRRVWFVTQLSVCWFAACIGVAVKGLDRALLDVLLCP